MFSGHAQNDGSLLHHGGCGDRIYLQPPGGSECGRSTGLRCRTEQLIGQPYGRSSPGTRPRPQTRRPLAHHSHEKPASQSRKTELCRSTANTSNLSLAEPSTQPWMSAPSLRAGHYWSLGAPMPDSATFPAAPCMKEIAEQEVFALGPSRAERRRIFGVALLLATDCTASSLPPPLSRPQSRSS